MMTQNRQNKLMAVCAAIGLHGIALALLLFSLPGSAAMLPDIGKLDFMWVTLTEKGGHIFASAQKNIRPPQAPSTPAQAVAAPEMQMPQQRRDETEPAALSLDRVASHPSSASPETRNVSHPKIGAAPEPGTKSHTLGYGQADPAASAGNAITKALPLYRENPPPGYPEMARQRGYEGVVLVEAEILTDGRVGQTEVRKSSGYAILDHAAVNAVRTWKFEPARKSGIPQKTTAQLPIKFVLNENHSQL